MTHPVVVTGAATGIGRAVAEAFAAAGRPCLLVDRDGARIAALAAALPGQGHAALVTDLSDPAQRAELAATILSQHGAPGVLVNNAGMTDGSGAGFSEAAPDRIAALQALNLAAPLDLVARLAPAMAPGGVVFNIASGAGLRALPLRGAYSATKAGLIAATAAQARQLAARGVQVLGIAPGFVRTELVESLIAAGHLVPERAVSRVPLGRMAVPAEIAAAILALSGAPAAALSGQTISVDGGSQVLGGNAPMPEAARPAPVPGAERLVIAAPDLAPAFVAAGMVEQAGRALAGAALDLRAAGLAALQAAVQPVLPRLAECGGALAVLLAEPAAEDAVAQADLAACIMACEVMACEWGRAGVRINTLRLPAGLAPETAAALADFLLSDAAGYVSGICLTPAPPGV